MVGVIIAVPPSLRKARTAAGESAWLDSLPELVREMASQWSLSIGRSFDGFGMNALVVEATTADGTAAVLKLARYRADPSAVPVYPRRCEDRGGRGCSCVARSDPAHAATRFRVSDARVAKPRHPRGALAD
jgi:hypothetical protein